MLRTLINWSRLVELFLGGKDFYYYYYYYYYYYFNHLLYDKQSLFAFASIQSAQGAHLSALTLFPLQVLGIRRIT